MTSMPAFLFVRVILKEIDFGVSILRLQPMGRRLEGRVLAHNVRKPGFVVSAIVQ